MESREYRRAELKIGVRQAIRQTRPRPFWVTLLFLLIVAASGWVFNLIRTLFGSNELTAYLVRVMTSGASEEEIAEALLRWLRYNGAAISALASISMLIQIVSGLWNGVLYAGYKGYCLSVARQGNPPLSGIFCSFPCFGRVVLTRVLVAIFTFLWSLAFSVGLAIVILISALLMASEILFAVGVVVMAAGMIAFFVAIIWLNLRYAMVDYLVIDQGLSGLDAITESKKMMKGNKGKLFVLHLSFIGWYLLMYAVILVGAILCSVIMVATIGSELFRYGYTFGSGTGLSGIDMAYFGAVIGVIVVVIVMVILIWIIDVWLMPYVTGSEAAFYDFFRGSLPKRPNSRLAKGPAGPYSGGPDAFPGPGSDGNTYTYHNDSPVPPVPPTPPAPPAPPAGKPVEPKNGGRGGDNDPPKPMNGPNYPEY